MLVSLLFGPNEKMGIWNKSAFYFDFEKGNRECLF